jgi:hypothetical protein
LRVEIYEGAGLGAGLGAGAGAGAGVACVRARVRRGCGRGCGVDAARRWPRVGDSGVGPGDRGSEIVVVGAGWGFWSITTTSKRPSP